jgi:hypothetical protein
MLCRFHARRVFCALLGRLIDTGSDLAFPVTNLRNER